MFILPFIAWLKWSITQEGRPSTVTSLLVALTPSSIYLGTLGILAVLFHWLGSRRNCYRSPLTHDLLRAPGHSLLKRIEDLNLDINCCMTTIVVTPLFLYSSYISGLYFGVAKEGDHTAVVYGFLWIGMTVFLGAKLRRLLKVRHDYRLGLDCEMVVGQELNNLIGGGYRVYHDVPAEGFNIDHVVVGHNGVFAVETKGRSKRDKGRGPYDATVVYDGRTLKFPGWIGSQYLDQARRQAEWLSGWLTEIIGGSIPVQPVLVIPGWYVKRVRRGDVLVLNGKKDVQFIATQWTRTTLHRDLVQRIGDMLEEVCRDVEPIAYKSYHREETPLIRQRKMLARVVPIRCRDKGANR